MNVEDIKVGIAYKVDAVNTSSRDDWTVREIKQNKRGAWEVTAVNQKKKLRVFTPEQFRGIDKKMENKIVSESVQLVLALEDGTEMWVERIDYMPFHEKRGRKPQS